MSRKRTIHARPFGNDTTGDGTRRNPYATMRRAVRDVPLRVPQGARYIVDITDISEVLPTDYELPAWKTPKVVQEESLAPYFLFTAAVTIQATPQLVAVIPPPDATVAPVEVLSQTAQPGSGFLLLEIARTGTGDSFTAAAGIVTLTDAAGLFTASMVGRPITISGASTLSNNGTFVVASFISASQLTYANAGGVAEVFPGTWLVGTPRVSWGGNALKGKFLVGASALENCTIVASTTATLLLAQTLAVTGTLRIMEPSATITASSTLTTTVSGGFAGRNCDSLAINGLRVLNLTAGSYGLETGGGGISIVQLCELQDPLLHSLAINSNRFNRLWIRGAQARVVGSWSLQTVLFDALATRLQFSALGPVNGNWRRVAFIGGPSPEICNTQFPGQTVIAPAPAVTFVGENVLIADIPGTTGDGLRFHGVRGLLRNADIRNCGRDGVRCEAGSGYLELFGVLSTSPNGTADPTAVGVRVTDGMIVRVNASTSAAAAGTQLRAAGGEMKVGVLAPRLWSDFVGTAPIKNEYDLSAPFAPASSGVSQPPGDELPGGAGTGGRSGSRLYQTV
jgi:hypothetical protein